MKRTALLAVMIVLIAVSTGLPGRVSAKTLPLATVEFPPFTTMHNGHVTGVSAEIIRTVLARMGYTPEFRLFPTKRAHAMASSGQLAGLFTITSNAEREKAYHLTQPLAVIRDVFFKRKDQPHTWRTMADLAPFIIGATRGYNYAPVFLKPLRQGQFRSDLIHSNSPELQHLRKLKSGRIDMAICEVSVCTHLIKTHAPEFDALDYIPRSIGAVRPFHLGFSRKWPGSEALVRRFNQELQQLEHEGALATIYASFGILESQQR
ncbi:MAG: transporter substrate-binding domain-containing protein [Magnetococcales bacterium]|nr:transporter substrate-binding domain-containing protein [Magnetococcales bacterium]